MTTHTLSYTTQGLIGCGKLLGEEKYTDAAKLAALPLFESFQKFGKLSGTFNSAWQPTAKWECLTGNAQTSLVWHSLSDLYGEEAWAGGAKQLTRKTLASQRLCPKYPGVNGGIPGSSPINGGYDPYSFPNHAAKFHLDALLTFLSADS